jgi:tetratricopeptide (TPR) repeat protein
LAQIHTDLGDQASALNYLALAQEWSQNTLEKVIQSFIAQVGGYIHLQNGDLVQAATAYRQTMDMLAGTEIRDIYLNFQPYYAEVLVRLGRPEEALAILESSLALAQDATAPHAEGVNRRVMGQLLTSQGDYGGASVAFDQAIKVLGEIGGQLTLARAYYHRAMMFEQQGSREQAILDATLAQAIFIDCEAARDLEQATALLARLE